MYNDIKLLNYVMSEFVVNSFIKVRLEFGKTNIYINDELFKQCKYVLTKKKIYELEELLEIDSIDELETIEHKAIDKLVCEYLGLDETKGNKVIDNLKRAIRRRSEKART